MEAKAIARPTTISEIPKPIQLIHRIVNLGKSFVAGAGGAVFVIGAFAAILTADGMKAETLSTFLSTFLSSSRWTLPLLIAIGAVLAVIVDVGEDLWKKYR